MAVNTDTAISNVYHSYSSTEKKEGTGKKVSSTEEVKSAGTVKDTTRYGKTVGEPQLSEKAAKYYESLKKKYGNYDFVLVSNDQKANAQANASKYANAYKTVVLIDEAKIEKMATDEKYRKQYEGILSGAKNQLAQMKTSIEKSGANVQGYGMQINDGGTASFFAVLKKSSAEQKTRIEKSAKKKKAAKKEAEKKAARKEQEERIKKSADKTSENHKVEEDGETITIKADSMEELMQKIQDYTFAERSDNVQTETEKQIGQTIDFKG